MLSFVDNKTHTCYQRKYDHNRDRKISGRRGEAATNVHFGDTAGTLHRQECDREGKTNYEI